MDDEKLGVAITLLVEQLDYSQRVFLARRALLGIKPEDRTELLNSLVQLAEASKSWRARGPRDPFAQPRTVRRDGTYR